MRRTSAPLLILLILALALTANSSLAASRGAALDALLPDAENWYKYGESHGGLFGQSAASAGDTNADGFDDVIIGSPLFDPGTGEKLGAAFIYQSNGNSVDETLFPVTLTGIKGSNFGWSVSSAGDVNNDGYDDVIVGAPRLPIGQGTYGAAYLYLGSISGVSSTPAWTVTGALDSELGCAVAGVGDVDKDNFDDVLVGACKFNSLEATGAGAVYLYLGTGSGLQPEPAWSAVGGQEWQSLGAAVAGAGDLNDDGYADFIVGAPDYDDGYNVSAGAAYIWYGAPSMSGETWPGWTAFGSQWGERFGSSVAGAGDVDGNDYNDVIIGSIRYSPAPYNFNGAMYVFLNHGIEIDPLPARRFVGPDSGSEYGSTVAGLGDLNNDGYADVGVGAPYCDNLLSAFQDGCVFVYSGSPYGLSPIATWKNSGGKKDAQYGMGLGGAGDINGDGYADLIVGAPRYMWDDKTPLGKVAVYHGGVTTGALFYRILLPLVIR